MQNWKKWLGGLLLAAAVAVWRQWPGDQLRVVACDVGQGDTTLVIKGKIQILVDGGPANNRVLSCLGRHLPFWDRQIEMIAVSHDQADHIGGIEQVLQRYKVKTLMVAFLGEATGTNKNVSRLIESKGIKLVKTKAGDKWRLGEMRLAILWPTQEMVTQAVNGNDLAMVMQLTYGKFDLLFTGDIESKTEDKLVAANALPEVEVLKISHHGSKTSSTESFLRAVNPRMGIIEVGKNNSYGHPNREVLERLDKLGIKIFRTDIEGDVIVESDGNTFRMK